MNGIPSFSANNHSAYEIKFRSVDPVFGAALAESLIKYFPLSSVDASSIVQVNEAEQASNNFRVAAVAQDGHPLVLLARKNILLSQEGDLAFAEKVLSFLRDKGLSVPRLVRGQGGEASFISQGHGWQVFEFVPGNHYSGDISELVSVAKEIAKLHCALADFPYRQELEGRRPVLQDYTREGLDKVLAAAERRQDELDTTLHGCAVELRHFAERRDHYPLAGARLQIVHGDLHPHNTIFSPDGKCTLLDFDLLQHAELLRDVGFAAHRFSRQHAVCKNGGASEAREGFRRFLEAYCASNPLTDEEVRVLPGFILDELLRRIVTDFSRYYFENITRFANVRELEKKMALLREAEYLANYV